DYWSVIDWRSFPRLYECSKGIIRSECLHLWLVWVMTFVRLFKFYSRLASDVKSHDKGPGFFTLVAGTCVFGSQVYTITNNVVISSILWGIGIFLWILVMYTFFTSITIRKNKPSLGKG